MANHNVIGLVGQRFGRLEILSRDGSDKNGNAKWLCRCECGAEKSVYSQALRSGATQSCGCMNKEINAGRSTHGMSATSEYKAWAGMVQRCTNPKNPKWSRYGARGITVCDRWRDFESFRADMGARPAGMTIDRKDNDGNYEPGNSRWATQQQQGNNRGNNHLVVLDGAQMTLSDAARKAGISLSTLRARIRSGWSFDRAAHQPTTNARN